MHMIVETPTGCDKKMKYEPAEKQVVVHKRMPNGMRFPFNFGFIPDTLGEDGDPLDVIILSDVPLPIGAEVDARLLGCLPALQTVRGNTYRNDRFVAAYNGRFEGKEVHELDDLPAALVTSFMDFFHTYLGAEKKSIASEDALSAKDAAARIAAAVTVR